MYRHLVSKLANLWATNNTLRNTHHHPGKEGIFTLNYFLMCYCLTTNTPKGPPPKAHILYKHNLYSINVCKAYTPTHSHLKVGILTLLTLMEKYMHMHILYTLDKAANPTPVLL